MPTTGPGSRASDTAPWLRSVSLRTSANCVKRESPLANNSLFPYADFVTQETSHILVVDDDRRLRELLSKYLTENGFRVSTAADAAAAKVQIEALQFDLIVVDVMMPGENGLELTRTLRTAENAVPVLLLTAMGEAEDRIAGLEAGADDYLAKPFEPRELLLRIRTILRRAPPQTAIQTQVNLGELRFDLDRDELREGNNVIRLTDAEIRLLRVLAENAGRAVSREELTHRSQIHGNTRTIDVHIARLRRKIESNPKVPRYLRTLRGSGYILRPD
ncbi:MAG: response regulator transcription factor [Alphaproteobacteria bacterium]|nr:response regulator transcription factor [Alphaproteobacteria bacterium]